MLQTKMYSHTSFIPMILPVACVLSPMDKEVNQVANRQRMEICRLGYDPFDDYATARTDHD